MNLIVCVAFFCVTAVGQVVAGGEQIVTTARSQTGVPYSRGGGGWSGKSKGIEQGVHTVGFDCSGLTQYAVYKGTGKKIARNVGEQFEDHQCSHVPYDKRQPGDLVFFEVGGHIYHVGIISGPNSMIHAPHSGDHVREATIYAIGRVTQVARCL